MSVKLGMGSLAYVAVCQLPASSFDNASQLNSPAVPCPDVVRSKVLSCNKNGTPSLLNFTSHSNIR